MIAIGFGKDVSILYFISVPRLVLLNKQNRGRQSIGLVFKASNLFRVQRGSGTRSCSYTADTARKETT